MTREHPLAWPKTRASAILQSHQQIPLQSIASIAGVCRQTVSIGLESWETKGICGLLDKAGRGKHKILSADQEPEVLKLIKATPRSLNTILSDIESRWNITLSKTTLKRLCKQAKFSWKRVRKSLRAKRRISQKYLKPLIT